VDCTIATEALAHDGSSVGVGETRAGSSRRGATSGEPKTKEAVMARRWWTLVGVCTGAFLLLPEITIANLARADTRAAFQVGADLAATAVAA
jgi:uncharacterized membrane protein YdcZ (DUF606 family)